MLLSSQITLNGAKELSVMFRKGEDTFLLMYLKVTMVAFFEYWF